MPAALEMVGCERQNMRLTRAGCARLWLSAQEKRPQPFEGRLHCLTCPRGAANAGRPGAGPYAPAEALRSVCPRCRRVASRMISNQLCVSCWNRAREARIGRNAKGSRPRLCDRLHAVTLAVIDGDAVRQVHQASVVSVEEAMLALARTAKHALAFGRVGLNG